VTRDPHFEALERMYRAAPINRIHAPTLEVRDGEATIELDVTSELFHAAGAVHGAVYFKMLDDAAYFAANSLVRDVCHLTVSFTTYLTRPVTGGRLRARGRVVHRGRTHLLAEAVLFDEHDREVGRGSGMFARSEIAYAEIPAYAAAP
jgi:uncharacterized protein (TIGR00369 family)